MKRLAVFLALLSASLWSESSIVSSIPLPKTYVLNLDPYACDKACLAELISHEQVFSFLAQMPEPVEDPSLNEQRLIYVSLFNLDSGEQGSGVRIALLLPERVIGRYAASTTNSVSAYLLSRNKSFELKTFSIGDESPEAIETGLQKIVQKKFHYVIAPLTKQGANRVAALNPPLNIFFPTVNAGDVNVTSDRLYFGGIDYRAQIDLLMTEATPPLIIFYDRSPLGEQLKNETKTAFLMHYLDGNASDLLSIEKKIYAYPVGKHTTNLKPILKNNKRIKNGTFFLNTPLVKSGMIMSQLTLYDVNASRVLSTQINYDALLFDITQPQDRKTMLIANSISERNSVIVEANKLLGNDIAYDWINYATTIGIDYFYHLSARTPREYLIPIENHQIKYPVSLFQPNGSRFERYEIPEENYEDQSVSSLFE